MSRFSVARHWPHAFEEEGLRRWVEDMRRELSNPPTLGLVFMAPTLFPDARQALEILQVHGQIPLLAGCSSHGHIARDEELEESRGLTLGLYSFPETSLRGFHFGQDQVEEANGPGYWRLETGIELEETNGWLAFLDPFSLDSESWLKSWNEAYAPLPVLGGLASGAPSEQSTQIYLNGDVFEEGGVAISFSGGVKLSCLTSQGCTPIGDTWTLTRLQDNIIQEIGNRRAYDVLAETFSQLSPEEQLKARGNLFIGLVVNEYLEEFHRGDFLVRNLIGADPKSGGIAVGAMPRLGQTVQFQRRSASAATEDLKALLENARSALKGQVVYGGCLCVCNGRGSNLFGAPSHDARMVRDSLGPVDLVGFFCNGEIGPVGKSNFLHGYTATLALFVSKNNADKS